MIRLAEAAIGPPNASLVNPVNTTRNRTATAIVYCEANFGAIDGKTANGLVRHSERYEILSVIDSDKAGLDTGMVLDGKPNAIPVCRDLVDVFLGVWPYKTGRWPVWHLLSVYRGLRADFPAHDGSSWL